MRSPVLERPATATSSLPPSSLLAPLLVESTRAKTDDERPGRRLHAGYDDARRLCETGECATCRSQVYGEKDIQVRRPPRPAETQLCNFFDRSFNRQAFAVRPGEEVNEALRGFDPATIMTAAFNGINWWCEQAALVQEMSSRRVQEEGRAHAEGYKSKLLEVHSAYKRAKAKAEALWQQMQQLELDKKELQSKYEQKSGEKRRIEASYRELQTRSGVAGGGGGGGGGGGNHPHAPPSMPPPSRRLQHMSSRLCTSAAPPGRNISARVWPSRPTLAAVTASSGFCRNAQTRPISPYSGDLMSPPQDYLDDRREWRRGGGGGGNRGAPRASRGGYRPPHSPTRSHHTFSIGN